jgi:predicted DCC family thiol-disulfide oxidoreductase YuxK
MAYGKGQSKDLIKRVVELGTLPTSPDLLSLRSGILRAVATMAASIWPNDILQPIPHGKEIDAVMLRVQSELSKGGLNSVWGEKARLLAKSAVLEQWKRAQRNLFGRLKNVCTVGDKPMADGVKRLINLPEAFSMRLTDADIEQLQDLAARTDFASMLEMFRRLGCGDFGLTSTQADALRAMLGTVRERCACPAWSADAVIQLHLDYRCLRGGKAALLTSLEALGNGIERQTSAAVDLLLASASPRCDSIVVPMRLCRQVSGQATRQGNGQIQPTSLLLELGSDQVRPKMVVVRPPGTPPILGCSTVVAEDFGFTNTSSIVVLRGPTPIGEEALARIGGHNGGEERKVTKTQAKAYLEEHMSRDDVEVLEAVQFDGRDFLARVKTHAAKVDRLRSEIDRLYNRLERIRAEINMVATAKPGALVPEVAAMPDHSRYLAMHARFFRLLRAINCLKEARRAVYRTVAGLKKSWFGYVAQRKADLAAKHDAVVVTEDLDILAVPTDDPAYKGRTFNKMINNGSKGQYILRSRNTLTWRGIRSVKIPSFYTSTTDWRNGKVDKDQRRGAIFRASSDGRVWDADLHAAEMIGRYLFLKPKSESIIAALTD